MKLAIGIPTLNRADLLNENLKDLSKNFFDLDKLIIVDNGNQNFLIPENLKDKTIIHRPGKNIGVAASWNYMLNVVFDKEDFDYLLLLNDDIVLGKNRKSIEDIINNHRDFYIICGSFFWSIIILSKKAYKDIGKFDENFYPAYYEDDDYYYRIKLKAGKDIEKYYVNLRGHFVPAIKRNSMTIKKEPAVNKNFSKNGQYYKKKWGGTPRHETFKYPFNKMKKINIDDIKNLWAQLGTQKKPGSSIKVGTAYHEVPFSELALPTHRHNLKMRIDLMISKMKENNIKIKGAYGLDLGCSVGGLSFGMCKAGAKQIIGVDYDKQAIDVAVAIEKYYNTGAIFLNSEITLDNLDKIIDKAKNPETGRIDFVMWFSQFMWLVKQHDLEYASEFLAKLSRHSDVMFFETSHGDAMAGDAMKKYNLTSGNAVREYLEQFVSYQTIINLGNVNDGWGKRDVFFMCKPLPEHRYERRLKYYELKREVHNLRSVSGVTSKVYLDIDNKRVIKIYKDKYKDICWQNEAKNLTKLSRLPEKLSRHFPKILYKGGYLLELNYCGKHLTCKSIPEDIETQKAEILEALKKTDIVHRDVKPDNILIHNGVIILIDFGWATDTANQNKVPKEAVGLGMQWKSPRGFDDKYSFNKSIEDIKNANNNFS